MEGRKMSTQLKSKYNHFPERYHMYALKDLITNGTPNDLTQLRKDIQTHGLFYPIVVRSNEHDKPNKLFVQIGNQRVQAAKDLNYTHISGYYSSFEDPDFGNRLKWKK